jgi:hypothetical protein
MNKFSVNDILQLDKEDSIQITASNTANNVRLAVPIFKKDNFIVTSVPSTASNEWRFMNNFRRSAQDDEGYILKKEEEGETPRRLYYIDKRRAEKEFESVGKYLQTVKKPSVKHSRSRSRAVLPEGSRSRSRSASASRSVGGIIRHKSRKNIKRKNTTRRV